MDQFYLHIFSVPICATLFAQPYSRKRGPLAISSSTSTRQRKEWRVKAATKSLTITVLKDQRYNKIEQDMCLSVLTCVRQSRPIFQNAVHCVYPGSNKYLMLECIFDTRLALGSLASSLKKSSVCTTPVPGCCTVLILV